ncbi:CBS domain-containing protein [Actinacidiphila acididurans]|uniref:CBS domain-containing protein n=1 Tax=Actinacidiphila acididurans TaxID=2784346 RepID=A0ABS2U186_9ACTN|nr:CBS domain-containing protein [Actinacidiphila acididurans]
MKHRTVGDLMTHTVHRVHADTPFKEIVKRLADHDITAVPVVDGENRPLGVVSEADLLRSQSGRPDPSGLLAVLDPARDAGPHPAATTAGELSATTRGRRRAHRAGARPAHRRWAGWSPACTGRPTTPPRGGCHGESEEPST